MWKNPTTVLAEQKREGQTYVSLFTYMDAFPFLFGNARDEEGVSLRVAHGFGLSGIHPSNNQLILCILLTITLRHSIQFVLLSETNSYRDGFMDTTGI